MMGGFGQRMFDWLTSETGSFGVLLPFGLAFLLAYWSPNRRPVGEQALTLIVTFSLAFSYVRSQPLWPPAGGIGYIPYLGLLGFGLAVIIDLFAWARSLAVHLTLAVLLPVAIVACIAFVMGGPYYDVPQYTVLGMLAAAGVCGSVRLADDQPKGLAAPIGLITAVAALCVVSFVYGSRVGWHVASLLAVLLGVALALALAKKPWSVGANFVGFALYFGTACGLFLSRVELSLPVGMTILAFFIRPIMDYVVPKASPVRTGGQLLIGIAAIAAAGAASWYFT